MNSKSHELITNIIFELYENKFDVKIQSKKDIIDKCVGTDSLKDLEFINVEGPVRDNPHAIDSLWIDIEDKRNYYQGTRYFTAFNHFIDIRKGMKNSKFDDYDGYSYRRGSGSEHEYQYAKDATTDFFEILIGALTDWKVDKAIMKYFHDEYVHTPVSLSYTNCSKSIERYSFNGDKGIYSSYLNEIKDRFPLAETIELTGNGIPYSIFMPVDNMARYWYSQFEQHKILPTLGPVLHALQDAIIPHHAAGCLGNWHGEYENKLEEFLLTLVNESNFRDQVTDLFVLWNSYDDKNPPNQLKRKDLGKTPSSSWRIDFLVTWLALNAYNSYNKTYNNFSDGFKLNEEDALDLTQKLTAMCMLMLKKAGL